MPIPLTGLVAATFTPLTQDGAVDLDTVPALVDHLARVGVAGLYINGSTGEGPSLTIEERRRLAEAYIGAARGRLATIVQVGTNSTRESRELAAHAAGIGADAVSSTPPMLACYLGGTGPSRKSVPEGQKGRDPCRRQRHRPARAV